MTRRAVPLLAACLLAGACSSDPEPTRTSGSPRTTAPPPASSTPAGRPSASPAAPTVAAAPPFDADTARDVANPSGGPLTVVAVRVARQKGFDRVVFELDGEQPGVPGWRVEYEQDPRQDGSGDPVEVAGEATLVVRIDGAGYPYDTGQQEARSATVPAAAQVVREVRLGSVFEGVYESFIGVSAEKPFRVTRLADPARVVVDVRHE